MSDTRTAKAIRESITTELKSMLADDQFKELLCQSVLNPLMAEIRRLEETIAQRDNAIAQRENTIDSLLTRVDELETRADDLEQYTRRNSLRVAGLAETPNERPIEMALHLANATLQLDPPLASSDIDRAHRSGRPSADPTRPRSFLIKFATYQQRERVWLAKKKLRSTRLYVNEDLTKKRNALLWQARTAKREGRLSECWSMDGRIYAKKPGDDRKHQIKCLEDIATIELGASG